MARTVRNAKLDTRSARSKLPQSKSGYWVAMAQGCALGYRKGVKGGRWVARMIREGEREERTLGAADDYLDSDGEHVLAYAEAQKIARAWFSAPKESNQQEPPATPHTVGLAADEYLEAYRAGQTKGGGKGLIETVATLDAFVRPTFGDRLVMSLTKSEIEKWHRHLAETPPRKRTRSGAAAGHHEVDMTDPDVIRARRASANRVLTVLKAVLNRVPSELLGGKLGEWVHVKPFREVDAPTVRWIEQAEAKRLLNAAAPDLRRLATGALLTGARYSELARFRVRDFASTARGIHVGKAKGQKPRFIHLTEEGVRFFAEQCAGKQSDELVFLRATQVREKGAAEPRIVMEPWGKSHQIRPIADASKAVNSHPIATPFRVQ
jgi:integrase